MMLRSPSAYEFTPTNVPAAVLEARTVGRADVLERIEERIGVARDGGGMAHTLVVGARGSGKTHLLTVAAHRAAEASEPSKLLIVSLSEDAEGVVSYSDLLYTTIERALTEGSSGTEAGPILDAARASRRDPDRLEEILRRLAGDRTLALVVENLDRVFGDIGIDGQRRLRALVEDWRQVLLLASTPLLFHAVADRDEPWYGSFVAEHLTEVGAEEGAELLICLARERGDEELAEFLASDRARERLRAVAHIAGGSPRMWVMLSGCLTVDLLDDLVPLVERLLENLVPYYQARLAELPGNERKLVIELARTSVEEADGSVVYREQGARTVSDLAQAAGIDRDIASISLRRLLDARWVRIQMVPGTDRRTSWYELAEPLFRHHLQHRETGGGTLAVVVGLLKAWYSSVDRVRMLGRAPAGSPGELHLRASLDSPPPSDAGYESADLDVLLGEAKRWDGERTALGPIARTVAIAAVRGARRTAPFEVDTVALLSAERRSWAAELAARAHEIARTSTAEDERERVRSSLLGARGLAAGGDAHTYAELSLLAAGWTGACGNHTEAVACLTDVATTESHRLALALDAERAFFMWASGEPDRGRELTLATLVRRRESFGDDDPDTLTSRGNAAYQAARIGDHAIARDELLAVSDAQARVLGPDHPSTLTSRHNAAYEAGQLGDRATARDEVIAVSADRARVLGPDHPHTLISRRNAAYEAGALDDHALAREELLAVKEAEARVLGPDHPSTLTTRHGAACQAAALGDHATARTELAEIAAGRARVLGPEHPDTLDSRAGAAVELVDVGRPIEAIRELTAMIAESKSSPRSTTILFSFSRVLGRIRAPDEAEAALAALSSLGLEMTFEAVLGAVAVVPGDESELATWLGVWSQTTAGRDDLDRLSRLFDAAGKLLGGEPGPAHALPDEQRRVALMIAERGRTSPD